MSSDLVWELTAKQNAFLRKAPHGKVFNVRNLAAAHTKDLAFSTHHVQVYLDDKIYVRVGDKVTAVASKKEVAAAIPHSNYYTTAVKYAQAKFEILSQRLAKLPKTGARPNLTNGKKVRKHPK